MAGTNCWLSHLGRPHSWRVEKRAEELEAPRDKGEEPLPFLSHHSFYGVLNPCNTSNNTNKNKLGWTKVIWHFTIFYKGTHVEHFESIFLLKEMVSTSEASDLSYRSHI